MQYLYYKPRKFLMNPSANINLFLVTFHCAKWSQRHSTAFKIHSTKALNRSNLDFRNLTFLIAPAFKRKFANFRNFRPSHQLMSPSNFS